MVVDKIENTSKSMILKEHGAAYGNDREWKRLGRGWITDLAQKEHHKLGLDKHEHSRACTGSLIKKRLGRIGTEDVKCFVIGTKAEHRPFIILSMICRVGPEYFVRGPNREADAIQPCGMEDHRPLRHSMMS
eukprot:16164696-Heterocapsa_arctica.AAC.1